VAAILNFMADHPGQAFALTDLVRALKLSRATCHALLAGLVDVGYLYRAGDKTYVLGPKLAAIGRTAAENLSSAQVTQPELRRLADEFDVVCSAFFLEGDTIHLRERAASVSHVGFSAPLGTRVKLRVPSGAVFVSWSPAAAKALLESAVPLTEHQRAEFFGAIAFGRAHGFIAFVRDPGAGAAASVEDEFLQEDSRMAKIHLLSEIEPDRLYDLTSITAPVFGAGRSVAFVMGMMGFNRPLTGAEILSTATTLKDACGRIGAFMS
jgi:DNA-binding IclR family transcriptional regulator